MPKKRRAVPKLGHLFFQWPGTLSGHFVTEEGDIECSEDTLRRVDHDPVSLKPVEENPYI
jgi:hypothetical protein